MPRGEIAGSFGNSIVNFLKGIFRSSFIAATPVDIPTNSTGGFPFLDILSSIYL